MSKYFNIFSNIRIIPKIRFPIVFKGLFYSSRNVACTCTFRWVETKRLKCMYKIHSHWSKRSCPYGYHGFFFYRTLSICYFQRIHVAQTRAAIMESVSWTDMGDTHVNVSVVTPEVDVRVGHFCFSWGNTIYHCKYNVSNLHWSIRN